MNGEGYKKNASIVGRELANMFMNTYIVYGLDEIALKGNT